MSIRIVTGVPSGAVSPPRYRFRLLQDVLSPMRDGVLLAMDVIRPETTERLPVILLRTPYNKVRYRSRPFHEELARRGYIVAIQDCRGRFNSDGAFDPYRQEREDGFDTIEWLAGQAWCDGQVGMIGSSYEAQTQWLAASRAPTALKAIVPTVSPPGHPFMNEPLWGGVMLLATPEWIFSMGRRSELIPGLRDIYTAEHPYLEKLPLALMADAAGGSSAYWNEWLAHPTYDDYWRSHSYEHDWSQIRVPALNITGWYDMNLPGAPRNFSGLRTEGGTVEAREGQRLVIGPWPHWVNRSRTLSGVDFGALAVTDLDTYTLKFFDSWLRGETNNGLHQEARVHVFVMGACEWWEADEWPLPGTASTPFFLRSAGGANTHRGNGWLSREPPAGEPSDRYDSDPLDPVRVLWNLHAGPVDDRPVSARSDVLCYTSEALQEPLDVVGPVKLVLFASSSARDCDWHVRLADVYPDGTARFLCHGVLRSRFRFGYEQKVFLEPGRVERYDIELTATGNRFLPHHRIRIEIASSWFSRFERNPQTDAVNWMTDDRKPVVAEQRVFHDSQHPSCVLLPVIRVPPATGTKN